MTELIVKLDKAAIQRAMAEVVARIEVDIDAAIAHGYARAVANLRDLDRYRAWLESVDPSDEPLIKRHADYLEATQ